MEQAKGTLLEKLKQYFTYSQDEKKAKKLKDPLNVEIKGIMKNLNLETFEEDGVSASLSVQERTKMNEARLLKKLQELGFTEAIKQVEVVDEGVLEALIYDGKVQPEDLVDCQDTNIVEVLKVTVKKGGKK